MAEGPLTHDRGELLKFLDRYGAKEPDRAEALRLRRLMQGVVLVDDVRHLVRPLSVPSAVYYWIELAVVGLYSGAQIRIGAKAGAYVVSLTTLTSNMYAWSESPVAFVPTAPQPTAAIRCGDELPQSTTVETGTYVAIPAIENRVLLTSSAPQAFCPFYLPPGAILQIAGGVTNSAALAQIQIQEIP